MKHKNVTQNTKYEFVYTRTFDFKYHST